MKRTLYFCTTALLTVALFYGCATTMNPPATKGDYSAPSTSGLQMKADVFALLIDSSSSMGYAHNGAQKLAIAKTVASGINQSAPPLGYKAGLMLFSTPKAYFANPYGVEAHDKGKLQSAIDSVDLANWTPMANAFKQATPVLGKPWGKEALFIISDGETNHADKAVATARKMATKVGSRLCVYPILVGNSPDGSALMTRLSEITSCGFLSNADDLLDAANMAAFIRATLLEEMPPPPPAPVAKGPMDSDGDGVYDDKDQCPNTPKGAQVDSRGCWVIQGVYFDTNSANIKPESNQRLDRVVKVLNANPGISATIEGHTDNRGSATYNQGLSERRAKSVKEYFITHGVSAGRLSSKGYGLTRPATSNDTKEGRAQNRRVEISVP